ncbi:endo alpha-1,4 polygalactosaminidase [soil metagenome]
MRKLALLMGAFFLLALAAASLPSAGADPQQSGRAAITPPPVNKKFDYQIGDPYKPPHGVKIVSRDWYDGDPIPNGYSICYVNAFQTQDNYPGVNRPDERNNWPKSLVLKKLGDDPHWGGEYLVDISTASKRRHAAQWVSQMIDKCAQKGYDAVEYDNLDSWTRFNGTPLSGKVPFGKKQAVKYAAALTDRAHDLGMAVGQKNTSQLSKTQSLDTIGFDFAIAEECGHYRECGTYTKVFGNHVISIEYKRKYFKRTCKAIGKKVSVVMRDRLVTSPGSRTYVYDAC